MPEVDLSAEAIARLRPAEVVALLDGLDAADPALAGIDLDAIGAAADPRRLTKDQFVGLLAALDRLARDGADVDLRGFDADTFARIVSYASSDQVKAVLARPELRRRLLDEVFARMGQHLRTERAAGVRAVVHWRLSGGTGDGGYDRYETIIADGACTAHAGTTRDARATLTLHPVDLLKLITRNASGPVLFLTGKLKIKGDLGFAAGLPGMFELPRP